MDNKERVELQKMFEWAIRTFKKEHPDVKIALWEIKSIAANAYWEA